ncbi:MAG: hypothetical protein RLY86_3329 [Pseudomonadota bacterium]|jgi:V8-like Glu-specific endopeptidase
MTVLIGAAEAARFPNSAIVLVQATFPDGSRITGSGVVVGRNDVLTASHVVHQVSRGGQAREITVIPGADGQNRPFGTFTAATTQFGLVDRDGDGLIYLDESTNDFALLGFAVPLGHRTGWFGLDPFQGSGTAFVSGYPGLYRDATGPRQTRDSGTVTETGWRPVWQFGADLEVNPGNSGGPLWREDPATGPEVIGIVSTGTFGPDVYAFRAEIAAWLRQNDILTETGAQTAIYRFYNTASGSHFYTASAAEREVVTATLPALRFEGVGYIGFSAPVASDSPLLPVHRFLNTLTSGHFYTIDAAEAASVRATLPGFRYEGTGFYALAEGMQQTTPVYRFFNTTTGGHLFTTSAQERDSVMTYPTFRYEGIAFYTFAGGAPAPATSTPITFDPARFGPQAPATGFDEFVRDDTVNEDSAIVADQGMPDFVASDAAPLIGTGNTGLPGGDLLWFG